VQTIANAWTNFALLQFELKNDLFFIYLVKNSNKPRIVPKYRISGMMSLSLSIKDRNNILKEIFCF